MSRRGKIFACASRTKDKIILPPPLTNLSSTSLLIIITNHFMKYVDSKVLKSSHAKRQQTEIKHKFNTIQHSYTQLNTIKYD